MARRPAKFLIRKERYRAAKTIASTKLKIRHPAKSLAPSQRLVNLRRYFILRSSCFGVEDFGHLLQGDIRFFPVAGQMNTPRLVLPKPVGQRLIGHTHCLPALCPKRLAVVCDMVRTLGGMRGLRGIIAWLGWRAGPLAGNYARRRKFGQMPGELLPNAFRSVYYP